MPAGRVQKVSGKQYGNWEERRDAIRRQFPEVEDVDWHRTFGEDEDVFARVMRDLLKVEQAVPGRPGPRPSLDFEQGMATLRRLGRQDFSTLPFAAAFRTLAGNLSLTQLARKVAYSRSTCYRLLNGMIDPDIDMVKAVARGFKKHPSYFLEYRAAFVVAHLQEKLMQAPESTIGLYEQITKPR